MQAEARYIRIALTGPASERHPALVMHVGSPSPEKPEPYTLYVSLSPEQFDAVVDTIAANVDLDDDAFIGDEAGYYVEIRDGENIRSRYLGSPSAAGDLIDRIIACIDAERREEIGNFRKTLRA